jgi:hypothetical protein
MPVIFDHRHGHSGPHAPDVISDCISACEECQEQCLTAARGLPLAGGSADSVPGSDDGDLRRLLEPCAEICGSSARLLKIGTEYHRPACQLCAQSCEAVEFECHRRPEQPMLQACAAACRRTALLCRDVSAPGLRAA